MSSVNPAYFDCEKFIIQIEKRPILYEKNLAEFSNKTIKDKLWSEVCEAMVENWGQMKGEEKIKTGKYEQFLFVSTAYRLFLFLTTLKMIIVS